MISRVKINIITFEKITLTICNDFEVPGTLKFGRILKEVTLLGSEALLE